MLRLTAASRLTPIGTTTGIGSGNGSLRTTTAIHSSPTSPTSVFATSNSGTTNNTTTPTTSSSLNFESFEPDQVIATLHRSPTNGNVFTVLRKKLASKNPTDKWVDAFCKADGIHFLLDAWKTFRDKPLQKLSDAYFQRECMECLKVAMDSPVTLDYVTDDVESHQKILAGKCVRIYGFFDQKNENKLIF